MTSCARAGAIPAVGHRDERLPKEDLCSSQEAGFAEHLVKPVGVIDLVAAIRRLAGSNANGPGESPPGPSREKSD